MQCMAAARPGAQPDGVASRQRFQRRVRFEAGMAREQVDRPGHAGLGEEQHRPDQGPVQQGDVEVITPPHQVEVVGGAVDEFAADLGLASETQALVRRQQRNVLAALETQAHAIAVQQHQFALDAGKGGKIRVLLDLRDRQPQRPVGTVAQSQDLARPALLVAPALAPVVVGGNDVAGGSQGIHGGILPQ